MGIYVVYHIYIKMVVLLILVNRKSLINFGKSRKEVGKGVMEIMGRGMKEGRLGWS